MTQGNNNPLQSIIGEFKNISPEITNFFIFDNTGKILACNEATTEEQSKYLILAFNRLADHAQVMGGIQTLTIHGTDNQLNIIETHKKFLTTVSSRSADEKIVKSLTNVIVPTVLSLVYPIGKQDCGELLAEPINSKPELEVEVNQNEPEPLEGTEPAEPVIPESIPIQKETESIGIEQTEDSKLKLDLSNLITPEASVPKPFASQFMVEKIGGLLVASDTVRIDNDVIAKWNNLYGDRQIVEVQIENLEGKAITCKFKPIKETNVKGLIQIPEKILQTLQTGKGKLVIVKPIIAQTKGTKD